MNSTNTTPRGASHGDKENSSQPHHGDTQNESTQAQSHDAKAAQQQDDFHERFEDANEELPLARQHPTATPNLETSIPERIEKLAQRIQDHEDGWEQVNALTWRVQLGEDKREEGQNHVELHDENFQLQKQDLDLHHSRIDRCHSRVDAVERDVQRILGMILTLETEVERMLNLMASPMQRRRG